MMEKVLHAALKKRHPFAAHCMKMLEQLKTRPATTRTTTADDDHHHHGEIYSWAKKIDAKLTTTGEMSEVGWTT